MRTSAGGLILLLGLALGSALPAAAQAPASPSPASPSPAPASPAPALPAPAFLTAVPPDLVAPAPATAAELPAWFKYLHFLAGISVGLSASELVRETSSPWVRPLVAIGAAMVAGIGKEVLDSTGFGDPRVSDAVVTSIGGITAAAILFYAQTVYPAAPPGPANSDAYVISTAAVLFLPVFVGAVQEIQRYIDRRRAAAVTPAG